MSDADPVIRLNAALEGRVACRGAQSLIASPHMRYAAALSMTVLAWGCGSDTPSSSQTNDDSSPDLTIPVAATAWIAGEAKPFLGTGLDLPNDDLEFLRKLVGDARVVALGENTLGTRDFVEMKALILRFLVEEMEFDAFAIEATFPESERLDRYVRTGEGDSARLLTGLYFWTWRTESVLEMIEWMRSHNASGGDVGFYGFDMQFPGMAMWNVINCV